MNIKDRFNQYVKIVGSCYEWQSTIKRDGYGQFWMNGKSVRAHRAAYELLVGDIPEGKMVLHKCDNRKCVNPDHLYIGTAKDNVRDMHERGRFVGHRKLTTNDVLTIKSLISSGVSQVDVAEQFDVEQPAISKIVTGRTHRALLGGKISCIR